MNWGELQSAVQFRLNRPDLPDAFILEMLQERIDFYGPSIFYPAEITDYSIITSPGQFFYPLPSGTQKVNFVRVLYGGIWIPVGLADHYSDILFNDPLQPPFTSLPVTLAAVYGKLLRLFPTPDGQYPVELTMDSTIAAPTSDADTTSFWVTDGRMLLINATCLEICTEYLDISVPQSPRIAAFAANTQAAFEQLMTQAHQHEGAFVMRQYL